MLKEDIHISHIKGRKTHDLSLHGSILVKRFIVTWNGDFGIKMGFHGSSRANMIDMGVGMEQKGNAPSHFFQHLDNAFGL